MKINEFIESIKQLGINITDDMINKLNKYYEMLISWNEKINLTSITQKEEVYLKHFYDSLTLIKSYDLTKNISVCDVGTGAGFPGLVLKVVFPNLNVTLVDALNKRVKFLNEVIKELNLKNIVAVHQRAEEFAKENREKFDIVTSRAVAKLNVLNELCLPMVKINGYFIPMKANIEDEINLSKKSLQELNYTIDEVISFTLPKENSIRNLIKIKKIGKIKEKYPRNFDKIKKNPL